MKLPFSLEVINKVLDTNTFTIEDPFELNADGITLFKEIKAKMHVTGTVNKISFGEPTDFITYDLTILSFTPDNRSMDSLISTLIHAKSSFNYHLSVKTEELLKRFLVYLGINSPVLIDNIIYNPPKDMNENLIIEGKYDSLTRQIVKDIITVYKNKKKGKVTLPKYLRNNEEFYQTMAFDEVFSVNLILGIDGDVENFDVDGEYYHDENIDIKILTNPDADNSILWDLAGELNEVVRHELEHIKQYEAGYKFPKAPKNPEKYYSQSHELEAQRAGFKRQSKIQKTDFETLVRDWFKINPHKHRLNPKQIEKVIQRIITEV